MNSPLSRLVYVINSLENWFGKITPLFSNTALVKVNFSKKDVKGQLISGCPFEILDFSKIAQKI